ASRDTASASCPIVRATAWLHGSVTGEGELAAEIPPVTTTDATTGSVPARSAGPIAGIPTARRVDRSTRPTLPGSATSTVVPGTAAIQASAPPAGAATTGSPVP